MEFPQLLWVWSQTQGLLISEESVFWGQTPTRTPRRLPPPEVAGVLHTSAVKKRQIDWWWLVSIIWRKDGRMIITREFIRYHVWMSTRMCHPCGNGLYSLYHRYRWWNGRWFMNITIFFLTSQQDFGFLDLARWSWWGTLAAGFKYTLISNVLLTWKCFPQ